MPTAAGNPAGPRQHVLLPWRSTAEKAHRWLRPAIEWVWFPMAGLSSPLYVSSTTNLLIWVGIGLFIIQSAPFLGLKPAVFLVSRILLEGRGGYIRPTATTNSGLSQ